MTLNKIKRHNKRLKEYFKKHNEVDVFKSLLYDSKSYLYYLPKDIAKIIEMYLIQLVEINRITTKVLDYIFYTILMYNCIIKVRDLDSFNYRTNEYKEYYINPSIWSIDENSLSLVDKKSGECILLYTSLLKNYFSRNNLYMIILNKRSRIYRFFAILYYYQIFLLSSIILIILGLIQLPLKNEGYTGYTVILLIFILLIEIGVYRYLIIKN